jgi:hypothetical protein
MDDNERERIELRQLVLKQAISKQQGSSFPLKCGAVCDHKPIDAIPDLFVCRECNQALRWKDWIYAPCRKETLQAKSV